MVKERVAKNSIDLMLVVSRLSPRCSQSRETRTRRDDRILSSSEANKFKPPRLVSVRMHANKYAFTDTAQTYEKKTTNTTNSARSGSGIWQSTSVVSEEACDSPLHMREKLLEFMSRRNDDGNRVRVQKSLQFGWGICVTGIIAMAG